MQCLLRSFWVPYFLFCLELLVLRCGEAKVLTEVKAGPLYRVVGSSVSIVCNVSGFIDESVHKEFDFRVKLPGSIQPLNIISTYDKYFTYGKYRDRVENQEITLIHLSPNSVQFVIKYLDKSDEGMYECSVKNTELKYYGTYNAEISVKVIENLLTVSPSISGSASFNETDALTLSCQAFSNTVQHTHLSVAWYLHKEDEEQARLIMSLDRDFTLRPGSGFEGRYKAGLVRLDKISEAMYKLTIARLELSDQGRIYCQAQEWIRDPDFSWYSISQKDAGETTVTVKGRVNDLQLEKKTEQLKEAEEGEEVKFQCTLTSSPSGSSLFNKVTWFYNQKDSIDMNVSLAKFDHTGLLVYPEHQDLIGLQERLILSRPSQSSFCLVIQQVHVEDHGAYWCMVEQYQLEYDGHWEQKASVSSDPITLSVKLTESELSIAKRDMELNVSASMDFTISCVIVKQSSPKSEFQITWFRQENAETAQSPMFTVYRNSTHHYRHGKGDRLKFDHPLHGHFNLTVLKSVPLDSGIYSCEVEEWLPSLSDGWRRVAVEPSGYMTVHVRPDGEFESNTGTECKFDLWTGLFICVIICSVVIFIVQLKCLHRAKISKKKSGRSHSAEVDLMAAKPST